MRHSGWDPVNSTAQWLSVTIGTTAYSESGGHMDGPFDPEAYLDTLEPMAPEQRLLLREGATRVSMLGDSPDFQNVAMLHLATLVLVGDVDTFDENIWQAITALRLKHGG